MINFVQHVHTTQPKARPVDDRTVIRRTSSDHLAVTHWGMRIVRWSDGHPQVAVRRPAGDRAVSVQQPEPKFRTVAHGPLCSDRQVAGWRPTDEWLCVASADHLPNFNSELKCSGRRPTSKGWALQECLFRQRPPDLSPMGTKWGAKVTKRWPLDRFVSFRTSALLCVKS